MALPATPTTVSHGHVVPEGLPILMRLPIALCPGHWVRASSPFTMTTSNPPAVSCSSKGRPSRSGTCIVSKYRGPTTT